jgi:hypothetical protein
MARALFQQVLRHRASPKQPAPSFFNVTRFLSHAHDAGLQHNAAKECRKEFLVASARESQPRLKTGKYRSDLARAGTRRFRSSSAESV